MLLLHGIRHVLQQGFVVFINEDDRFLPCQFCSSLYYTFEAERSCRLGRFSPVKFLPLCKRIVQYGIKAVRFFVVGGVQVKVEDGMHLPFLLHCVYIQSSEQIPAPRVVGFEGREEQALAEPAGTAEKIILPFAGQLVYLPCLVNIGISILSYSFKRLYSYRVFHFLLLSLLFQEVGNRGDDGCNAGRTGSDTERLGKAHPALYLRRNDDFAAGTYFGVVSDLG